MTEEEFNADLKRRLKGQPSEPERSVNFVAKPPEGFNKWVIDHADRIASAKSLPYYIRQNQPFVDAALAPKVILTNNELEFAKNLNIHKGKPMSFAKANSLRGNPNYIPINSEKYNDANHQYHINCQSCVVAHELRRRGYDVKAVGNTIGSYAERLSKVTELAWIDADGRMPISTTIYCKDYIFVKNRFRAKVKPQASIERDFHEATKGPGRYHVRWKWIGKDSGHIITFERFNDGDCRYYDPQDGSFLSKLPFAEIDNDSHIKVLRVDNLDIEPNIVSKVVEPTESSTKTSSKASSSTLFGGISKEDREEILLSGKFQISNTPERLENLSSKKLIQGKKSLQRTIRHCRNKEEIEALEYIWNHPQELVHLRHSPMGEDKNMNDPRVIKNIARKRQRGVVRYQIYSIEIDGRTWYIKTEEHKAGFEQFYTFTKV